MFLIGLTGSKEGLDIIVKDAEIIVSLLSLLYDHSEVISKDAALCLVNISAIEEGAIALVNLDIDSCKKNALQTPPKDVVTTVLT